MADFVQHPIQTSKQVVEAVGTAVNLVHNDEWGVLAEAFSPEMHQLVTKWDTLSSEKKGELAGYVVGKHGADILVPGALAKVASKSLKSAQELAAVCKNLKIAQETLILETATEIGSSVKIAEVVQLERRISEWLGEGTQCIRNKAGDPVFLSKDGIRRVRFDFNNPHGDVPHMHMEQKLEGSWHDASSKHRIYPVDE